MTDTEIILGVGTTILLSYSEKNRIEDVCLLLLPLHVYSHNLRVLTMIFESSKIKGLGVVKTHSQK